MATSTTGLFIEQLEASTGGGVNLNYFIVKLTCICLKINNFLEETNQIKSNVFLEHDNFTIVYSLT